MTTPANGVGPPALHADPEIIQLIFSHLTELQADSDIASARLHALEVELGDALTRIAAQDAEIADLRQDIAARSAAS